MARRDECEYWAYLSEEQRSQPGCPARELCCEPRGRDTSVSVDPTAPNHHVTVVEHDCLARCNRGLWCVEDQLGSIVWQCADACRGRSMTMADLCGDGQPVARRVHCDPIHLGGGQRSVLQSPAWTDGHLPRLGVDVQHE